MKLFDVYPLNDITIDRASGSYVWDNHGVQYLDMYGGHAVISIGHCHPHWVKRIETQLNKIAFYSNSVRIPLQQQLAVAGEQNPHRRVLQYGLVLQQRLLQVECFQGVVHRFRGLRVAPRRILLNQCIRLPLAVQN